MSDGEPLNGIELWIMRLGWTVIAGGIVFALVQQYANRR